MALLFVYKCRRILTFFCKMEDIDEIDAFLQDLGNFTDTSDIFSSDSSDNEVRIERRNKKKTSHTFLSNKKGCFNIVF